MEKYAEAKTFIIQYECDNCHKSFMNTTKFIPNETAKLVSDKKKYMREHECPLCGHKVFLEKEYPYTISVAPKNDFKDYIEGQEL